MHSPGERRCGPVLTVHVRGKVGGSNGNYTSTLTLRVLPLGSGKLCVVTAMNHSGEIVAAPYKLHTQGTRIKPELACPSA